LFDIRALVGGRVIPTDGVLAQAADDVDALLQQRITEAIWWQLSFLRNQKLQRYSDTVCARLSLP
jgi:hypothetical protein